MRKRLILLLGAIVVLTCGCTTQSTDFKTYEHEAVNTMNDHLENKYGYIGYTNSRRR